MSPRRQQLIIAEACGITGIVEVTGRGLVYGVRTERGVEERRVPNYLQDLNAMHEAEKILTLPQWHDYAEKLGVCFPNMQLGNAQWAIHATAPQRAEAFLKAIGKWEDE